VKRLALVGCGHIGGSLALALRREFPGLVIVGVDPAAAAAAAAKARGVIDSIAEAPSRDVDAVVVAVPVRSIPPVLESLAGFEGVVTDVGSTKAGAVRAGDAALARFVGGHPMAGTERAGVEAADPALFVGKRVILTPTERTDRAALVFVRDLWARVGARVVEMDAAAHDRAVAAVSHLPHLVAYALAGAVGDAGDFAGLAGGGFTDTTRIAATPPSMWVDVFLENAPEILALVRGFDARLGALRAAIERGDGERIARLIDEARAARAAVLG
jgi:prephenate dehydrogenase